LNLTNLIIIIYLYYFRTLIPPVIWAQRNDVVYVTICVEDSKNPDIKIETEQIVFHSVAGLEQKVYDITIPLYGAVEPEVNLISLFCIAYLKKKVLTYPCNF